MSDPTFPDTSKSDDEQFEDALSKEDFNERSVDEIIEKFTGMPMERICKTEPEEFVDCVNDLPVDGSDNNIARNPEDKPTTSQSNDDPFNDDVIDEDSQRDYESNLTEQEKEANKAESNELKQQGNEFFKQGEHRRSVEIYTSALRLCPLDYAENRAILYANRAAAKAKLDLKPSAIDDCSKALEYNPKYLKALLRRASLYEETDKMDESLEDFRKVLELDSSNIEAKAAQIRLPPKIAERNERLKDEMMGKLKDLGNMILRPFGLSTQNFQMQQDPQTGSYSINFNQNAKQ
ncbi:tetratricopeptide repeat protein 1 [Anopheles nili]|uniref:tetratricopeptide repeat protein 1 n=1 Tax=Anopheles nili TaxID=185578 RepID=UPI00237B1B74|nr:tetratricopeptide repeat protein 1 [Anopheles nili]